MNYYKVRLIFRLFVSGLIVMTMALDSHAQRFVPHTFMAGIDVPGVVRTLATSGRSMGEVQLAVNTASHLVIFEYGFENIKRGNDTYRFNTRGPYFRTGVDLTLNPKNPAGHKIFTGFRYAQANYKNDVSFQANSDLFNDPDIAESNDKLKGSWLEWTFGMKIMLSKFLGMGYTMRYKFSQDITGGEVLSSFDLPGYGRARKSSNFGLSYYVFYRLKFGKEYIKVEELESEQ